MEANEITDWDISLTSGMTGFTIEDFENPVELLDMNDYEFYFVMKKMLWLTENEEIIEKLRLAEVLVDKDFPL